MNNMNRKPLRVMHGVTEIAGQNAYSVLGLRKAGDLADTVVAYKHPFAYPYDVCLNIDMTKRWKYPLYVIKAFFFMLKSLFKYDIYHFHFGRSICLNKELWIYDFFHKGYYYEFHGSDLRIMEEYCKVSKQPYNESMKTPLKVLNRNKLISKKAKGIILHDDELIPYLPEKHAPIYVVPLRVDIEKFSTKINQQETSAVRIVHGSKNRPGKGTDYVEKAYNNLKEKYANIELVLVEGMTQEQARQVYESADIIVDQLFIGTYGVFSIEAMALGKPVITYISNDMVERLPEDLPIVNADIDTIEETLEHLILDKKLRIELGNRGRQYVEDYHDYRKNAIMLDRIYRDEIAPIHGRDAFEYVKNLTINDITGTN